MKRLLAIALLTTILSCNNEKVVQLPEIKHSKIHNLNDVSAAYLFYDANQKDSVELNRKNLISTTNWLINVDKRLTLKQLIPHIQFLQKKKDGSSHKNKKARNYYTCNDTSIKNLGFIDFTDIIYHTEPAGQYFAKTSNFSIKNKISIVVHSAENIQISGIVNDYVSQETNLSNLISHLNKLINKNTSADFILNFNQNLSFQDYITLKSVITNLESNNWVVLKHEFIFN